MGKGVIKTGEQRETERVADRRGRDRMVVGYTTTYAITYHH